VTAPYPPYQQAPRPYPPLQFTPPPPYGPPPQAPWQQGPQGPQGPWQPGPWQAGPWQPAPRRPWVREPWAITLGLVVVFTLLAGVVLAASSSGGGGQTGTTTAGGSRPGLPAGPGKGGEAGKDCPGGSLENCFSEGQMQVFLNQAVVFVHGFSDERYSRMPHPAGYRLVGEGRTANTACGPVDEMTYAYCSGDDGVYIGQKQLWLFYSKIGDAAAVVGLAHEYGHHIQNVAGVPNERTPRGQVAHENQADCIAGAFVGWAKEKGYLEDDDAQDISELVRAIASSEDDPSRDHGTLSEREASMSTGIRDGLKGCSAFFPDTPVHES
jgi:Putative neutral zinc metallopeptidase